MAQVTTWRCFKFLTSWFFETTVSEDEETPAERYLELAKTFIEQAQRISSRSGAMSPNFNHSQCKYLIEKLRLAVESAHSFFVLINRQPEPKSMESRLEIFKLLHALSQEVENFIQDCCKVKWIQAVVLSSNISGHISSLGFHLELCTVIFNESQELNARQSLTLAEVDGVFQAEVESVKEKASQDRETLVKKLNDEKKRRKPTSIEYQLADLLLERLQKSRLIGTGDPPEPSQSSLSETVFSSVKQMESLGKGSAATVYRAKWLGALVAMKTFYGLNNPDFKKEVSVLVGLSHPNIISLFCSTTGNRKCSIVMELMDRDLHSLMLARLEGREDHESPFGILEAVDIMLQIGEGMSYLHEMRIVHRDLKSMNILVRHVKTVKSMNIFVRCLMTSEVEIEYVVAKVADFGLSKMKEKSMTYTNQTVNLGTTRWMAPEMLKSYNATSEAEKADGEATVVKYPFKCDIYSFGMVCYEILTGQQPFFNVSSISEVKKKVLSGEHPELPNKCPMLLKSLIERCWSTDAGKRPYFGDICAELRHLKCLLLMPSALEEASASLSNRVPSSARYDNAEEIADSTPIGFKRRGHDKWLVGLDIGTTRTGFAYSYGSHLDQNYTVHYDYPSPSGREKPYCKTLTALYYKPVGLNGKLECASWGYLARSNSLADRKLPNIPQGYYLPNFRRFLRNDMNNPSVTSILPHPLTVNTIITDYLRHIGDYALTRIENHSGEESFSRDSVIWCVTVPSIWEVNAKEQMIKACMVDAGLVSGNGGTESVKVILEPEAASFHCHQILRQKHTDVSLHVRDKILVADIGGGTVDVVVQEVVGSGSDFKVRELTESSRGTCGGTSIDDSFMRFLSRRIGCLNEYLHSGDPSYRLRLLNRWEDIKCAFGLELMSDSDTMDIGLHISLAEKWMAHDKEIGKSPRESYFEIELSELDLKSIFDPVVEEILELVAAQKNQVQDINAMFVVGGFADSPYLMQRIRSCFSGEVDHIFSTHDPGSAVMEGAIALALTQGALVVGPTGDDSAS